VRAGFVEAGGFAEGDGSLAVAEVLAVLAVVIGAGLGNVDYWFVHMGANF
jgi:hypothetical protein